jgi:hypothetical protein
MVVVAGGGRGIRPKFMLILFNTHSLSISISAEIEIKTRLPTCFRVTAEVALIRTLIAGWLEQAGHPLLKNPIYFTVRIKGT